MHNTQQRNNKQHTHNITHNKQRTSYLRSHSPVHWLSGSWHTPTLHARQRSVQMRLEEMNIFTCHHRADDTGEQEQSLRGSNCLTHLSQFVLGTIARVALRGCIFACTSFSSKLHWVVGGTCRQKVLLRGELLLVLVRTKASATTKFRRHNRSVHSGANTCLHDGTHTQTYTLIAFCKEFARVPSAHPCMAPFFRPVEAVGEVVS